MKRPVPIYELLYSLKPIAQNIWIADGDLIEMDAVLTNLPFSTRMAVIKLANGQLWCHSPIQPNQALFDQLDALGPVAHLVSPNKIHYAYIADWKKRYPEAIAWSSPGVEKRAADQLVFKGSAYIEEVVFFHKDSQTLILTDLIENFETEHFPNPLRSKAYKLVRVAAPDGQTPIDYRMTFIGHQKEAKECLEQMLAWQPEKIILAHGRCFLENGTAELRRALRWIR